MGRFLRRSCAIILLIAVFFCGYAIGSRQIGHDVPTLSDVIGRSLNRKIATAYLKELVSQLDMEQIRETVTSFAEWVKSLVN